MTDGTYVAHDVDALLARGGQVVLTLQDTPMYDPITGDLLDDNTVYEDNALVTEEKQAHMVRKLKLQRERGFNVEERLLMGGDDATALPHYSEEYIDFEKSRKKVKFGDAVDRTTGSNVVTPPSTMYALSGVNAPVLFQSDYAQRAASVMGGPRKVVEQPTMRRVRVVTIPPVPLGGDPDHGKRRPESSTTENDTDTAEMKAMLGKGKRYEDAKDRAQAQRNGGGGQLVLSSIEEDQERNGPVVESAWQSYLKRINAPEDEEKEEESVVARDLAGEDRQTNVMYMQNLHAANPSSDVTTAKTTATQIHRQSRSTFEALKMLQDDYADVTTEGPVPPTARARNNNNARSKKK